MKKSLKVRSKSQLIQLIVKYASDLQETMELNKFLHEENQRLQGLEPKKSEDPNPEEE